MQGTVVFQVHEEQGHERRLEGRDNHGDRQVPPLEVGRTSHIGEPGQGQEGDQDDGQSFDRLDMAESAAFVMLRHIS